MKQFKFIQKDDSVLGLKLFRYITSDCDAVSIIYDEQGYVKEPGDAVADVLKAGS